MNTNAYTKKVDIYSLGVILFEMHYIFKSRHERATLISQLKKGTLPPVFQKTYSDLSQLVLAMTNNFPNKRPSANDLCDICSSCTIWDDPRETLELCPLSMDISPNLYSSENKNDDQKKNYFTRHRN